MIKEQTFLEEALANMQSWTCARDDERDLADCLCTKSAFTNLR